MGGRRGVGWQSFVYIGGCTSDRHHVVEICYLHIIHSYVEEISNENLKSIVRLQRCVLAKDRPSKRKDPEKKKTFQIAFLHRYATVTELDVIANSAYNRTYRLHVTRIDKRLVTSSEGYTQHRKQPD